MNILYLIPRGKETNTPAAPLNNTHYTAQCKDAHGLKLRLDIRACYPINGTYVRYGGEIEEGACFLFIRAEYYNSATNLWRFRRPAALSLYEELPEAAPTMRDLLNAINEQYGCNFTAVGILPQMFHD